MPRRRAALAMLVAISLVGLGACATSHTMDDYTRPDPVPVETAADLRQPPTSPPPAGYWTCEFVPTMNDDWHDDALCDNGVEAHRPYLLEWDDFVTEDELMQAADQYAAELNAQERQQTGEGGVGEPVWTTRGGSVEAPAGTWSELTGEAG